MKRSRDETLGESSLPTEAKFVHEPEKRMLELDGHLQQLLLQQKQLPAIPGSHQSGKVSWLAPLLSSISFTVQGYLRHWGLTSLLVFAKNYNKMFIHWEAIAALCEIWSPQTNTFIFPGFEATILLEEAELFLGFKSVKLRDRPVAHSMNQPSTIDFMSRLLGDRIQARNTVTPEGIKLSCLAKWIMKAKEQEVEDVTIARATSLCLAGLFFFPGQHDFLHKDFLGPIYGAWQGRSLAQAILAYLYNGLSSASLGGPFVGSMILMDIWIGFHLKMVPCNNNSDSRIRSYERSPIYRIKNALHYTDKMIIKTIEVRSRSEWREFLKNLPVKEFLFFSEALADLKFKTRPCAGVDLRLVGSKELVLYNAHRCYLQIGQPRHLIPQLSHHSPYECRMFGSYSDQVNVRSCLELWKISKEHEAKLVIPEEHELVKKYVDWIKQLRSTK